MLSDDHLTSGKEKLNQKYVLIINIKLGSHRPNNISSAVLKRVKAQGKKRHTRPQR